MSILFHVCSSLNKSSLLKPSRELRELSVESVINPLRGASEEKTHNKIVDMSEERVSRPSDGETQVQLGPAAWCLPIELVKKPALDLCHLLPGALEPPLQAYVCHDSVMEETSLHRLNGCRC